MKTTCPSSLCLTARIVATAVALITISATALSATADEPTATLTKPDVIQEKSVRPGINDNFLKKDLDVSEWIGRFELESREVYAERNAVLKATKIKPGLEVADIGAGTGFYSRLFADAVGSDGFVYAVDLAPQFLEHIEYKSREDNVRNLKSVLCTDRSVNLPANSIDVAFICDTYHHFEYPSATLETIHRALRVDGTLVLIDFDRIPGKSRDFILGHVRGGKEVFQSEIEAAGFQLLEDVTIPGFKENYLLRFGKQP